MGQAKDDAAPGVRPAHQTRSREQRDRLLKAGEQVFAARGYNDTHVAHIVELAGCSVGSFYRRFRDKEALFFALQGEMYERSDANFRRFFANPLCETASLTRIFFQLLKNSARHAYLFRGYFRALFEISLAGKDVWTRMRALETLQAEGFRDLLLRRGHGPLRPDFIPAVTFAVRMVNGQLMSMMLHGPGPYAFSDPQGLAQLCRVLMGVAGAPVDEAELAELTARPADWA